MEKKPGQWIRIRIGSGFNGVTGSGYTIRIQGQENGHSEIFFIFYFCLKALRKVIKALKSNVI
jgi:hypothetical protein